MSLYGPCANCWHSHGALAAEQKCPHCDCAKYREGGEMQALAELSRLRAENERLQLEHHIMRAARDEAEMDASCKRDELVALRAESDAELTRLRAIVRDLAALEEPADGYYCCRLCKASAPPSAKWVGNGYISEPRPMVHASECPWRRAREEAGR